jgi:hypothetical protein
MEKAKHPLTAANLIGQVLLYGVFALVIGVFSRWPSYQALAPDRLQTVTPPAPPIWQNSLPICVRR